MCHHAVLLLLALGVLSTAHAATPPYTPLFECPTRSLPGGIICSTITPEATQTAKFAVSAIDAQSTTDNGPLRLASVLEYGTQVVAGTNIYLTLVYADVKNRYFVVQALVYRNLQNMQSLSRWQRVPFVPLNPANAAGPNPTPLFACRAAGLPGGIACQPPADGARSVALFALGQINAQRPKGSVPAPLLAPLDPYGSQVVAGRNEYVTFVAGSAKGVDIIQAVVYTNLRGVKALTKWQSSVGAPLALPPSVRPSAANTRLQAASNEPKPPVGYACKDASGSEARDTAAWVADDLSMRPQFASQGMTVLWVDAYCAQRTARQNQYIVITYRTSTGIRQGLQVNIYTAPDGASAIVGWTQVTPGSGPPRSSEAAPSRGSARPLSSVRSASRATPAPLLLFACPAPSRPGGVVCADPKAPANRAKAAAVAAAAIAGINSQKLIAGTPMKLLTLDKFASQVVAGMNYFAELRLINNRQIKSKVQVRVFQDLNGKLTLSELRQLA